MIKNEDQAGYVLAVFIISVIIFSFSVTFRGGPKTEPPPSSVIEKAGQASDFY